MDKIQGDKVVTTMVVDLVDFVAKKKQDLNAIGSQIVELQDMQKNILDGLQALVDENKLSTEKSLPAEEIML
jgi:hypothetical protein